MTVFTKESVLAALEHAVALKGEDYIDPKAASAEGCSYTERDGSACCIVGHVVAELEPELLSKLHAKENWHLVKESGQYEVGFPFGVYGIKEVVGDAFDADPEVHHILAAAQTVQDNGGTWGNALKTAQNA